jgi:hypothetical protein
MRESAESIMYLLVSYKANGTMKIVYRPRYREVYGGDPASQPGRIEAICDP